MSGLDDVTTGELWHCEPADTDAVRLLFESVPIAALDLAVCAAMGDHVQGHAIHVAHANHAAHRLFGAEDSETLAHHVESQMTQAGFRLSVESALKPPVQTRECFGLRMLTIDGNELLLKVTSVGFQRPEDGAAHVMMFLEDTAPAQSLRVNLEAYRKRLSELVSTRNRELQTARQVLVSRDRFAESLVELRSAHTAAHMKRVAVLAEHIGKRMDIGRRELAALVSAARLHDIGIMHVPMEILGRSGTISKAERAVVEEHPLHARDILLVAGYGAPILKAVAQHHERFDGSGYPEGLIGDEICQAARVIAVADVLDAMIAPRMYRPALTLPDALANLERQAPRFDPKAIAACRDVCTTTSELIPELGEHERAAMMALSPIPALGSKCG